MDCADNDRPPVVLYSGGGAHGELGPRLCRRRPALQSRARPHPCAGHPRVFHRARLPRLRAVRAGRAAKPAGRGRGRPAAGHRSRPARSRPLTDAPRARAALPRARTALPRAPSRAQAPEHRRGILPDRLPPRPGRPGRSRFQCGHLSCAGLPGHTGLRTQQPS